MKRFFSYGVFLIALLTSLGAQASLGSDNAWQVNLTSGVTDTSSMQYTLHMAVFWVCVVIGIGVFGVMIYSMIYHRKSRGVKPATFHESITVEVIWTVIPVIILISLAIPAAQALVKMEDSSDAELTIKVTGYQWKWQYEYPEHGVSFFSSLDSKSREASARGSGIDPATVDGYLLAVDNPVVIPVGKKVRFLTTANDVIHAWGVPDLGIKKDAIPGFINDTWAKVKEPGTYYGKCYELCGKDHGFMPITLIAMEEGAFNTWLEEQKAIMAEQAASGDRVWAEDELITRGQEVYGANCVACHQAGGQGIPGVFPALTGSSVVNGDVEAHIKLLLNGVTGTAMQAFGNQLSDADLAAVLTFQRNGLGNSTGDIIQPADVKALR